ncbi:MAG: sugar transferase [Candidatus Sumerlaeaceae bacterium]|jgi:exopolysaccharide biosynthesis polyprenyl glycosylphosphotransferase
MLKERRYIFSRVNMLADAVVAAASVAAAHWLRNEILAPYFFPTLLRGPSQIEDYWWLFVAAPVVTVVCLAHQRYYDLSEWGEGKTPLGTLLTAAFQATVGLIVIAFFVQGRSSRSEVAPVGIEKISRSVIIIFPFVLIVLLGLKTAIIQRMLCRWRMASTKEHTLLLVGSGESLRRFLKLIEDHPWWGFRIIGIVDDTSREAKFVQNIPVVGTLKSLVPFLEKQPVDEVVFLPESTPLALLAPYFEQCEEMGIRTRLSLNFFRPSIARPVLDMFETVPMVSYFPTREMNGALLFKYAFDRVAAFVLLVLLSPVFIVTAILIKITSESWSDPIFYGQTRCGLNGKRFTCWKFRSMRVGADKEVDKLRDKNLMGGPVFKMRDDPRITPIGKFIRKTSIDELPQLWNVLRGEMSLVGPRPPIPSEVEKYDRWQRRRLSMKPGITCLWQVNGRNKLPFDVWMKLDLEYIDNWSLWLDFKILLKTIYVVATGYGAM